MIEQVEELGPELQSRRFGNGKFLHCGEIELIQIVAAKDVTARISISVDRWNRKGVPGAWKLRNTGRIGRRVEPASDISLDLRGPDQLRTLAARSRVGAIHRHRRCKWQAGLEGVHTRQLPTTQYAVQDSVRASKEAFAS